MKLIGSRHNDTKLTIKSKLTEPPVRTARSWRPAFLFSPKPGALIAQTCSKSHQINKCCHTYMKNQMRKGKRSTNRREKGIKANLDTSTKLIQNKSCQRIALYIFCDNQQRPLLLNGASKFIQPIHIKKTYKNE